MKKRGGVFTDIECETAKRLNVREDKLQKGAAGESAATDREVLPKLG